MYVCLVARLFVPPSWLVFLLMGCLLVSASSALRRHRRADGATRHHQRSLRFESARTMQRLLVVVSPNVSVECRAFPFFCGGCLLSCCLCFVAIWQLRSLLLLAPFLQHRAPCCTV